MFERFDAQAVLAAGSVVRGEGDLRSDLDVFVIQERPYKQRIQRWFGDVPVEIFINPTRAVRAYFASEHERGRPSTAHMMATGFAVFGADVLDPLRVEAAAWLRKRSAFAPDEDTFARYSAATLLEDGEDVMERDPAMASALFGEAVMAMIRYSLRVKRGTVPGNKSLLVEIEREDAKAGALARRFFTAATIEERAASARELADCTVGARGFFAWESEEVRVPEE